MIEYDDDSAPWDKLSKARILMFEVQWRVCVPRVVDAGVYWNWKTGAAQTGTPQEAFDLFNHLAGEAIKLQLEYDITLYCHFGKRGQWMAQYTSGKERVAPPHHRVLISIGGRDCDGFSWRDYRSFENLKEAQDSVEDTLEYADGPTDYCTLSVDDWECGEYPEYRDRFAEAMGY